MYFLRERIELHHINKQELILGMDESYKPSAKEIERAEGMMSDEELDLTMARLKSFGLAASNFNLAERDIQHGNLDLFLGEEVKEAIKQRISELNDEKIWEIRKFMMPYSMDPTRSATYNREQQKNRPNPQWAIFVGEAIEDELIKRGLVRRAP